MLYPNSTGLPQKNQRMNIAPRWIPLPPRALDAHGGLVGAHGAAPLGKLMFNAKLIIFNPKFGSTQAICRCVCVFAPLLTDCLYNL